MNASRTHSPPRIPWRLYLLWWHTRKHVMRIATNLRHRPFWSRTSWRTLHRMLDPRRLAPDSFPIVINNFNRYESLRTLVDWIQRLDGPKSIIILDNASTYPPVRAYYRTLRDVPNVQVVRLGYNSRLFGLQDVVPELSSFRRFVVTDPDLVPYPDTPSNLLLHMDALLDRYPQFAHIGTSLETRDIPLHYPLRDQVLAWESRYWPPQADLVDDVGYVAWVDTTFAMYRQGADVTRIEPAMRLVRPYTLKHVDWYIDPAHLSDEQRFYQRVSHPVASWTHKLRQAPPTTP